VEVNIIRLNLFFGEINIYRVQTKKGAVLRVNKNFISHRTPSAATSEQVSRALITNLHCVHPASKGLRCNVARILSILLSDTRGRPGLLPLHKHPLSKNCRYHLVMLLLCGASYLNR
jgi:hypothetical protein